MLKPCVIVPHFNHGAQFRPWFTQLVGLDLPIIIVDDGSYAEDLTIVRKLALHESVIALHEHGCNRGKGTAVRSACFLASVHGFTHAIQIDADGQHDIADVTKLLAAAVERPDAIVSGKPIFGDDAPAARVHGRKVTTFFVAIETLSLQIKDGLCGFRVYPLKPLQLMLDRYCFSNRMQFDTEILVKSVWSGVPLHFVDTQVIYPVNGVSHFDYLRDNRMLILLHVKLLAGMILRLPKLIVDRLRTGSRMKNIAHE